MGSRAASTLVVALAAILGCRRDERVTLPNVTAEPAREEIDIGVPLRPTPAAKEVTPGVFVLTITRPPESAARVENAKTFVLSETLYDATGRHVGGSVPSTTWSSLDASSQAQLAGMAVGEIRRVWMCRQEAAPCEIEDIEVLSAEIDASGSSMPSDMVAARHRAARRFRASCRGLEMYEIDGTYDVDWGWGTLRSKTDSFHASFTIGPMTEPLIPKERPAGFRWVKEESRGNAMLRYGYNVHAKQIQATLVGADLASRINLAAEPAHADTFVLVARKLATAECKRTIIGQPAR